MVRWLLTFGSVMAFLALGCAGEYETSDDDTYGEDDDAADDDAADDDVADDDASDDDASDDDASDDDDTTPGTSCNDWDPIDVPGASWVYQSEYNFILQGQLQGDFGTESVQTGGTTSFQGYTVFQRTGGFTGQQYSADWWGYNDCGAGGNTDFGSTAVVYATQQETVTTINSPEVMYLPYNPDQQSGYSWNATYTQTVNTTQLGSGSWAASWDYQIVGLESVSVPAGTYTAVHVHAEYTTGDPVGDHSGTLDTYWAENVGLLKWDESRPSETGQYILRELQSYSGL